MAEYNNSTRAALTRARKDAKKAKIKNFSKQEFELATEMIENGMNNAVVYKAVAEFRKMEGICPSQWLREKEFIKVFVPEQYRESFFYIVDKLNRFPFSSGWERRTVRSADYRLKIYSVLNILEAYDNLAYSEVPVADYLYKRLDEEKADYIRHAWDFEWNFNYIYAAEIDRGNQQVIDALKDLILSENNSAYLDREMILGILRSDNAELHKLLGDFLLAARLQEGVRQSICEAMDEGTTQAFLCLLEVIEKNNLIRYSSVKRAVSTWIGIFDENNVERVSNKLLELMGQCLRDKSFCQEQLKTNDSIAISVALWALGFKEVDDAVKAMEELITHGTKHQKLTVSYYNKTLYSGQLQRRIAKKVILEQYDDLELVTAFLSIYSEYVVIWVRELLSQGSAGVSKKEEPLKPVLTDYYANRTEAEKLYEIFSDIYKRLPKKGLVYDPCIFPWYKVELSRADVIRQLAFLAYVLQDEEKITQAAALLLEMSGGVGRDNLIKLLLYQPKNREQKAILINAMGITEEYASKMAISLVKKISLEREDYQLMEDMLRFKRSGLRIELLDLLSGQADEDMEACLKRLLSDKKEEKRTGGLDLLLRLLKQNEKAAFFERVKPLASLVENPSDKEKLLLSEIFGEQQSMAAEKKGFGFYDPDAEAEIFMPKIGKDTLKRCLALPEETIIEKLEKLDALIDAHKEEEYRSIWGETQLIGNAWKRMKEGDACKLDNYPLAKELRDFYEKEIGDYGIFLEMKNRMLWDNSDKFENSRLFYEAVFGKLPCALKPLHIEYVSQINQIMSIYDVEFQDKKLMFRIGIEGVCALLPVLTKENHMIPYSRMVWKDIYHDKISVTNLPFFESFFEALEYWETEEEFKQAFYVAWEFELRCAQDREREQFTDGEERSGRRILTPLKPYWFLKAYHMGLVSKDILYQALMHYYPRIMCFKALTQLVKGEYANRDNTHLWREFFGDILFIRVIEEGEAFIGPDTWCGKLVQELYDTIVPVFVDIELRRGEAETAVSQDMRGITYIQGMAYLIRILKALGKDTLSRDTYYSWYSWYYDRSMDTKKEVLSFLLKACYPKEDDDAKKLKAALKGTGITQERLVEVAMYAPQWIDIIEDYLGWNGLKSGCYYFMAHMNEQFDDRKKAMIAKYTPLSTEELQGGAFDIDWFRECYGLLGEKNFGILYKAAKYISDGQKHSRARKYADAATGKVTLEQLREEIGAKRNKDLLMSYGLVPFAKNRQKDLLARYQFIQQYAKEAKQFGAQRRASETAAAQTALVNLSVHAGFSDVTRLMLNMETELIQEFRPYMRWTAVEDIEIRLKINEVGKGEILCSKNNKILKSLPSKYKKNAYVLEVKDAQKN